MGVLCSIADDIANFWQAIISKKCGIREWEDLRSLDFKYTHAHRVSHIDCDPLCRGFELAKRAISQALEQAGPNSKSRIGLFLGTTMGESAAFEAIAEGNKNIAAQDYTGEGICLKLRKHFPQITMHRCFSTACAAGNYALKAAREALVYGDIDIAIAGGVDPFSKIAMTGFSRARAMSASGLCRPFSADRDGMVLGEGAGFMVLELLQEDKAPSRVMATLDGCALTCDAFHATAPRPDASGIVRCFNQLSTLTGNDFSSIDWICSHGTGTKLSDISEARAIRKVFGEKEPWVSSIKAHIGHTLGAATAIEAIVCVLSILEGQIPPTVNTKSSDLEVEIPTRPVSLSVNRVLNCGYAFGGLNSITQFSKWK